MKDIRLFFVFFVISLPLYSQMQWIPTKSLQGYEVLCMRSIGQELYAGFGGAGIYKTLDGGDTWIDCNSGLNNRYPFDIILAQKFLFTATLHGGVFRSSDGGKSWEQKNNGLSNIEVRCLTQKDELIFAGTGIGVFYSDDYGENWYKCNMPPPSAHSQTIFSFAVIDKTIIAGSSQNIFVSTDNGKNWREVVTGGKFDIRRLSTSNDILLMGSTGDGLFISTDSGDSWFTDNRRKPTEENAKNITAIIWRDTSAIIGTSLAGIFQSKSAINRGLPKLGITDLATHQNFLYAGTFLDGIWKFDLSPINPNIKTNQVQYKIGIFPNPSSQTTTLSYSVTNTEKVNITLYRLDGTIVKVLLDEDQSPGSYELKIEGQILENGLYNCVFKFGEQVTTKPLLILK